MTRMLEGPRRLPATRLIVSLARLGRRLQRLARPAAALAVILALGLPATPAWAGDRKAKKLYEQGRQAELERNYDRALELYELAEREDPGDHRYELAVRRMRYVAAQAHVDTGRRMREIGQFDEALAEFNRAMVLDPALTAAAQHYRRTIELLEERQSGGDVGAAAEAVDPAELTASAIDEDREEREEMVESLKEPPRLEPLSDQLIDITMSEQVTVVFETIGKLAGINVLFDPEFQDKQIDISIQNATLSEALDYASLIAKTYWKPISRNAIFVTNDNQNKRRDYEEEIVKTIYLNNVATPQELQEITTAIRGLTDIRRLFPVSTMNALVVRGTEARLALAEKVIHDIDKARPEVIVDVLVLEASKSKTRELGISPRFGDTNGISIPIIFGQGAGDTGGDDDDDGEAPSATIPLSRIGSVGTNDWVTTLPNAQLTALFSSSDTNLLQSPRIRALDNQQASLRIGDRIPIATGSFQPGIGGVGINPLVNTQFNYTDVGVNVDLQPRIHNDREVSLHIEIEISNVREFVDIGGIRQPVIGQRTITHDIRLEEGEASILGGLNQSQLFKTKSGVPFIGEIPLLGRLFSITRVERSENEILVALIPHIVRLPSIEESNLRSVASGTDQIFQVRYVQEGNGKPALPPAGAAQPPAEPSGETPAAPVPRTPEEPPAVPPELQSPPPAPTPATPQPTPTPAPAEQPAPPPGAGATLTFNPATPTVQAGQQFQVEVVMQNAQQLFGVPMRIQYNPQVATLIEAAKGPFLAGAENTDVIFSRNIRNPVGQAAINISRFPGTGGADGSGTLVTLTFQAVAPGTSPLRVIPSGARNASAEAISLPAAQTTMTVR